MNLRTLILAAPLAVVLACGGSTSTGTGSAALIAATPSYAKLSFDQTAADTSAPALASPTALTADAASTQMMGPGGGCHPHLFMREREVVERVNRHVYKVLGKVEHVITAVSFSDTTTSYTWTKTENGTDMSFTIKVVPPNVKVYDWAFSAAPTGQPLQPVMDGYIDRSNATADHDGSGEMDIDFANFHAAFPKEHVASGTIHVAFAVSETSRTISVVADKVTWELDASHFDGGIIPSGLQQPRSGEYLYFRQPGKGGSLKIHDEMVYGCSMDPTVTNANLVPADSQMVSQWYKADDGTIHGRSDGLITGGQLTGTQVDRIVGVTCHNASAEQHMPTEGFWLMKAEKADGSTLLGFSTASVGDTTSSTPCDTKFGPVPALANKDTDFNGWPSSYSEAPPFSYFTP